MTKSALNILAAAAQKNSNLPKRKRASAKRSAVQKLSKFTKKDSEKKCSRFHGKKEKCTGQEDRCDWDDDNQKCSFIRKKKSPPSKMTEQEKLFRAEERENLKKNETYPDWTKSQIDKILKYRYARVSPARKTDLARSVQQKSAERKRKEAHRNRSPEQKKKDREAAMKDRQAARNEAKQIKSLELAEEHTKGNFDGIMCRRTTSPRKKKNSASKAAPRLGQGPGKSM